MHTQIKVTWVAGVREDVRPVIIRDSWVPRLLGHDAVTIGRTIRVRRADVVLNLMAHAGLLRHELTHVKQQAGGSVVIWLLRYLNPFSDSFRHWMEIEAYLAAYQDYPQWRVV
jgi:hypothetical protein